MDEIFVKENSKKKNRYKGNVIKISGCCIVVVIMHNFTTFLGMLGVTH